MSLKCIVHVIGFAGRGGAPVVEKPAVYRPPGSTGSLAALMRAERGLDKQPGGKKISQLEASRATGNYIPGMPPQQNKPSKNAKKQVHLVTSWKAMVFSSREGEHFKVTNG